MNRRIFIIKRIIFSAVAVFLSATGFAQGLPVNAVGVCTSPTKWDVASGAGCQYIEGGVSEVLMPDKSDEDFSTMLAQLKTGGVVVGAYNLFIPGKLKTVGQEADHAAALKWADTAFERAALTGAKVIVLGSGGSRNIPDGFSYDAAWEQFRSLLTAMGPVARKHGVTVALEHLNTKQQGSNFITSLAEGAKMVRLVDDDNIKLLCDTWHMLVEGEPAEEIVKAGDLIVHVHVAELEGRAAPGVHGENLSAYYDALKRIGYKGLISMECGWGDFPKELEDGVKELKKSF